MGVLRTLPVTPPHGNFLSNFGAPESLSKSKFRFSKKSQFRVLAKTEKGGKEDEEEPKKRKQSLFSSVTEALDFSQTRSEEDALLLEDARQATKSGEKMSREQYAALRRKIGGTFSPNPMLKWTDNMWKKGGLTKLARCARRTPAARRGKLTSSEDTFMWRVWRSRNPATSLLDFSQADDEA